MSSDPTRTSGPPEPDVTRDHLDDLQKPTRSGDPTFPPQHGTAAYSPQKTTAPAFATAKWEEVAVPGYQIECELGRGAMGVVYKARDVRLNRPAALKMILGGIHADTRHRLRFLAEAEAIAAVRHPHVVQVFEFGEGGGYPFLALEFLSGGTFTSRLGSPLPVRLAAGWLEKIAWGVAAAHEQGIVHRDLKPGNILFDAADEPKVSDFGLAKRLANDLTATQALMGTPAYMAPEQAAGRAKYVGPAADVWALGVILYECVAGKRPFDADTTQSLLSQIQSSEPVPLRNRVRGVPRDLDTIVSKCLTKEPEHRYPTAAELAQDLEAFLDDRPIKARRQSALGRGWRWCRRNPGVAILAANMVAALVLAGIVGWVGYANTKKALDAEAAQLAEARRARTDAEKATADVVQASEKLETNLRMCLEAFEQVFDAAGGRQGYSRVWFGSGLVGPGGGVGPGGPSSIPGGGPAGSPSEAERAAVLEAVLVFYDKFAEQNATNPRLQLDAARAHRRIGEVYAMRGQAEKATVSFRRAAGLLEGCARFFPDDSAVKVELVQLYLAAPPDALPDYEHLLARAHETARELKGELFPHLAASVALKLGWVRERNGDRGGAEKMYREAVAELATPAEAPDQRSPTAVGELIMARSLLAALLVNTDRVQEARRVLEESVAALRKVSDGPQTGSRVPAEFLTFTHQQLAAVCEQLGDRQAADAHRAEASRVTQGGFGGPKKDPSPPRKKN